MSKAAYVRREVAKGQTRFHHCHARDCDKQVPPAYFMCARHWRMVPRSLQAKVWAHYKPGQEKGAADVSREYLDVTDEAIEAVAAAEGKASQPRPPATPPAKQLTLEDLTPHDRGEIEKFTRYLKRVADLGSTREAQQAAHVEIYGGGGSHDR